MADVVALRIPPGEDIKTSDEFGFDSKAAISAFAGALGSMYGLRFDPVTFWKVEERRGTHGKLLLAAARDAHRLLSEIIAEHEREPD